MKDNADALPSYPELSGCAYPDKKCEIHGCFYQGVLERIEFVVTDTKKTEELKVRLLEWVREVGCRRF
jgi:hypothetical protein